MASPHSFDPDPMLKYLGLPPDHTPSPVEQPLVFLRQNLSILPPSLLTLFSPLVTPIDRAAISHIRNRRLAYTLSDPTQLRWDRAAGHEPALWATYGGTKVNERVARTGEDEGRDEKEWAEREFMGRSGPEGHGPVGNIAKLLGGYEEERAGDHARQARRERSSMKEEQRTQHEVIEREEQWDEGEDEEEEEEDENPDDIKRAFERAIRERFLVGSLDWADYEADWDDRWDLETSRDQEERWFDDEDED